MQTINTINGLRKALNQARKNNKTIGLVATMGYFHEGHLTLMRQARQDCDLVVISIFVNPIQFGPQEDYQDYPRDLNRDLQLAQSVGVDIVFAPTNHEMYPPGYNTYVEVQGLTDKLEGRARPGHFRGVATIVTKLLNIIQPHKAYFGQKDYQQLLVVKQIVKDLNIPTEIIPLPTQREPDGLATSSRNTYLTPAQRQSACILYKSLQAAQNLIKAGERNPKKVYQHIKNIITQEKRAQIDYITICNAQNLQEINKIQGKIIIALAVKFGKVRLIDNIIIEV